MADLSDKLPNDNYKEQETVIETLPLLPLRDIAIFPAMVVPLFIGRAKSIRTIEAALTHEGKKLLLAAQRDSQQDDPKDGDIYTVGTVATVLQSLKLPDGTVKVLVEGLFRASIIEYLPSESHFEVTVQPLQVESMKTRELEAFMRSLMGQFEQFLRLERKIPTEVLSSIQSLNDAEQIVDTIAAHLNAKVADKQVILESKSLRVRIEHLMMLLETEIDLLQVGIKIRSNVKRQMENSQRVYFLNEQMKAIKKELGELSGEDYAHGSVSDVDELAERAKRAGLPKEAREKADEEIKKLRMMPPYSAEATGLRIYIETMLKLPWKKPPKMHIALNEAEKILEHDHYGLEKIKDRILEYLAVQERVQKIKGPILCLVGPPGVGKTSLGASIARATKRKFTRISLGGVRDEAEIRGHRRTYIGAMPGKILQKISKVGVKNPLILLDEIDKMSSDFRGDPAAALLEVLDPEQNNTFNDHYLEIDYDLSDVMFVATANTMNIPAPLLDRMEVLRIAGYTEDEKLNIAFKYLLPKQKELNGIKADELELTNDTMLHIIRYYTRESGVRNLEREISKLCRKIIRKLLSKNEQKKYQLAVEDLEEYLGVIKFRFGHIETENRIGQVVGLAWTEVGGEILTIEAVSMPGTGKIIRTGKLGDVMQESIQAAVTVVRSRDKALGIDPASHEKTDLHIHVPEGATPKDGPSAGIAMCTAIISVAKGIPIRRDVAMTGEITLSGQVLPIGGLKEKLLAARRAGITDVIIPKENQREIKEIPENIYENLKLHYVETIEEVWQIALEYMPDLFAASGAITSREISSH